MGVHRMGCAGADPESVGTAVLADATRHPGVTCWVVLRTEPESHGLGMGPGNAWMIPPTPGRSSTPHRTCERPADRSPYATGDVATAGDRDRGRPGHAEAAVGHGCAILRSMLDRLTADSFAPYEGTEFCVDATHGEPILLRLTAITRLPVQPHAPRPEPFSLELVGPVTPVLPQSIYALEHAELGRLDLFVVPLGPDREGSMVYEVAFN